MAQESRERLGETSVKIRRTFSTHVALLSSNVRRGVQGAGASIVAVGLFEKRRCGRLQKCKMSGCSDVPCYEKMYDVI